jgi:hypothetical protein
MLPAGRDGGTLHVLADIEGRVVQSTAINWVRSSPGEEHVRCVLRHNGGRTRKCLPDQVHWVDPKDLARIEVHGTDARQAAAVARLGVVDLPLVRSDQGLWRLEVDEAVREKLIEAEDFELELQLGASSVLFPFHCVPQQLDLSRGPASFVVLQRRRAFVPGSGEWLQVHLDDITQGHVLLEIVAADGSVVVEPRFVRDRDHVEFRLGGASYVITVDRLVNLLIGDDHGEFTVRDAAGFEPDPIGELLRAMEHSEDTFVREGKPFAGRDAATFLAAKLARCEGPGPTVDEFIDRIASRSSTTGNDYLVRKKGGGEVTMRDWLRAKRAEIEANERQKR